MSVCCLVARPSLSLSHSPLNHPLPLSFLLSLSLSCCPSLSFSHSLSIFLILCMCVCCVVVRLALALLVRPTNNPPAPRLPTSTPRAHQPPRWTLSTPKQSSSPAVTALVLCTCMCMAIMIATNES